MNASGYRDVDYVLTTREIGRMLREAGIDLKEMPDEPADDIMGEYTGAGTIFGTTGRTVYEVVTGREIPFDHLHVAPIVGFDRIKTATICLQDVKKEWAFLEGVEVRIAVTHGLAGAASLMEEIKAGKSPYLFIEIMGCPGGCISGGGQPRPVNDTIRQQRLRAIYLEDEGKPLRKSHENPDVLQLYEAYLGQPCGHLSHELLHTRYTDCNRI